jgi:hypothetical protein
VNGLAMQLRRGESERSVGRADDGSMSDKSPGEQSGDRKGIFMRLSPGGSAGSALSTGLGAFDAFVKPATTRAREELEQQHERVLSAPISGDQKFSKDAIAIEVPGATADLFLAADDQLFCLHDARQARVARIYHQQPELVEHCPRVLVGALMRAHCKPRALAP